LSHLGQWIHQFIKADKAREGGMAMILALIALALGMLMITPTLNYMVTGLQSTIIQERRTGEMYAADAGIEKAIWELTSGNLTVIESENLTLPQFVLNNATVDITIIRVPGESFPTYQITSTANTTDYSNTTIESYIETFDLSGFLDNAITTPGDVNQYPHVTINGEVDDEFDPDDWPTSDQFRDYYYEDVDSLTPSGDGIIWVQDNPTIGPLYRVGDLVFDSFGAATANLTGTIYVVGNLDFNQANQNYTIDLNGQTIFVDGDIYVAPNKVNFVGEGCIIAVGDIDFQPLNATSEDGFVFLMSIEGAVEFQPQMDFYGAVAGYTNIDIHSWGTITLPGLGGDLSFPEGEKATIVFWKIS